MAEIDFNFLGELIKRLQAELRQVRTEQLRQEVDITSLRAEMAAGFASVDARFASVDARFASVDAQFRALDKSLDVRFGQVHTTMAANLAVVLAAIEGRRRP
jgi:hypothetical protein